MGGGGEIEFLIPHLSYEIRNMPEVGALDLHYHQILFSLSNALCEPTYWMSSPVFGHPNYNVRSDYPGEGISLKSSKQNAAVKYFIVLHCIELCCIFHLVRNASISGKSLHVDDTTTFENLTSTGKRESKSFETQNGIPQNGLHLC